MKRNVLIVSAYAGLFLLFNVVMTVVLLMNQELIDDTIRFNQTMALGTASFYFVTAILLPIIFRKYIIEQFKDLKTRFGKIALVSFIGFISLYAVVFILGTLLQVLGVTDGAANQEALLNMMEHSTTFQFIMMIISISILAPIVEEIVFRKGVYGIVGILYVKIFKNDRSDDNKGLLIGANVTAIIVSSLAFGLIHAMDVYLIVYAGLGAVLACIYYFSGKNVFASIAVHSIYNIISLVISLYVAGI